MSTVTQARHVPDLEDWVARMQAQHGYAQVSVHDPASGLPGYAFTLGLHRSRHLPELLVLGVDPEAASQVISLCLANHGNGPCNLTRDVGEIVDVVPGVTLRQRRAPPAMLAKANAQTPGTQPEITAMMQILLPDTAGHFPGDPACDPQVAAAQDVDWLVSQTRS